MIGIVVAAAVAAVVAAVAAAGVVAVAAARVVVVQLQPVELGVVGDAVSGVVC